ncbi:hypothetical protein [Priestia megaterium]|uniref:hypothetical protein n=1 Tax=Priestia megaterium TaxID=1404 RepID=UPI00236335C0|nr:hypothetical protein [Priestia megaterium]MDD1515360.1 hypothetical protein [Priestia megaterium]
MRAKIEKAKHVVMFRATGEFYAHEVNQDKIRMGFLSVLHVKSKYIINTIISFLVSIHEIVSM